MISGHGQGDGLILDDTYAIDSTGLEASQASVLDLHELKVENNATALATVYQALPYDLQPYGLQTGQGWVTTGIFREIDIASGNVLFEWSSIDHVDLSLSYVGLGTEGGNNGTSNLTAWDYFHINSADKTPEGDYIISSRHTSCIYKISQVDGSIIWRLGGMMSSFALQNFNFSSQHDARFLSETSDTTTISLFDNASDGFRNSSGMSSGMVVVLNTTDMTASLTGQYTAPGSGLSSTSQGNMQLLANGNFLIGWGEQPYISEHEPDNSLVFFANLGDVVNYRAFKFNWTGSPQELAALFASAQTSECATSLYASSVSPIRSVLSQPL